MLPHGTETVRIQVSCDGVCGSDVHDAVRRKALEELTAYADRLQLANVHVEHSKGHAHLCRVQLLGKDLDHVRGQCEQPRWEDAVTGAVHRALTALATPGAFDPSTSGPPSSSPRRT